MIDSLSIMLKPASGGCNLDCDYCFYKDEMSLRSANDISLMSVSTAKTLLDKAFQVARKCSIAFQGGEPLLAGLSWLEEVVGYAKAKGYEASWSCQTNGTLIDDGFASFFHDNGFLLGVSLDGNRLIHNIHRSGSFSQAMEGIRHLQAHNVEFNILSVVTEDLADNIDAIWDFFIRNDFRYLQFIACMPPLGEPGRRFLLPRTYGLFLCRLHELQEEAHLHGIDVSIRLFDNIQAMLAGHSPEACDMNGSCSIQYVIESSGDCYPCDFYCLDEHRLGNILTDSFQAIDQKRLESGFLARQELHKDCKGCRISPICNNGCRRTRDEKGKFLYCESYKMLFGTK